MPAGGSPHHSNRSEISRRNETDPRYAQERRRLGLRLRQLRDDLKLTQEQAAEKIGMHPIHLGRIEGGSENVTLATLIAISHAYRLPIKALFDDAAHESVPMPTKLRAKTRGARTSAPRR